jgi:hypothetical protein
MGLLPLHTPIGTWLQNESILEGRVDCSVQGQIVSQQTKR